MVFRNMLMLCGQMLVIFACIPIEQINEPTTTIAVTPTSTTEEASTTTGTIEETTNTEEVSSTTGTAATAAENMDEEMTTTFVTASLPPPNGPCEITCTKIPSILPNVDTFTFQFHCGQWAAVPLGTLCEFNGTNNGQNGVNTMFNIFNPFIAANEIGYIGPLVTLGPSILGPYGCDVTAGCNPETGVYHVIPVGEPW